MDPANTQTIPGVYVSRPDHFPPIVGVPTAIPAFVGYTETATAGGRPVPGQPVPIGSMAEYEAVFGRGPGTRFRLRLADGPGAGRLHVREGDADLHVALDPAGGHNLYDSMRLFYANGGASCYVVSVGAYGGGIHPDALLGGLQAVAEQTEPTLLVVPEAVNLAPDDPATPYVSAAFEAVARALLRQAGSLQDRMTLLDVYGASSLPEQPSTAALDAVVQAFRAQVGTDGLSYGAAYFPLLQCSLPSVDEADFTWIDASDAAGGAPSLLQRILTAARREAYGDGRMDVQAAIDGMHAAADVRAVDAALDEALPLYRDLKRGMAAQAGLLPATPALAGVMTRTDANGGVWSAPANVTLAAVLRPAVSINNVQQGDLNMPVDGKAVDAIREFPGRGAVVWGARTLDGNSNDYRYIQVRRTLIHIQDSIQRGLAPLALQANCGSTWVQAVSMVSAFLQDLWNRGGLMGATASEAYSVQCGLGSTMTGMDVLEGRMIVEVALQLIRPAEFMELTFTVQMQCVA
jgi:hypothetical protein